MTISATTTDPDGTLSRFVHATTGQRISKRLAYLGARRRFCRAHFVYGRGNRREVIAA